MGAEQSKGGEDHNTYEKLLEKYQVQKKINHSSFGEVQILKDKSSDKQLGLKEFNLTDENEFNKTIEKFKPKMQLDDVNIIKLLRIQHTNFHFFKYIENILFEVVNKQTYFFIEEANVFYCIQHKESQFCSTFFKVYLIFEFVENTLEQEVIQRSMDAKQPFSEEEMWSILNSCIQGACFLYQNKLTHCNIRPSTIYITDSGNVKLAEPSLFSQPILYATALSNPSSVPNGVYIAPELLNDMYQQQYSPVYNQQKSDVFSLGMSMLHAALLQPLEDCYDYKNFSINENLIQQRLFQVRDMYGSNLYNFLQHMLAFNPEERQDLFYFNDIISQQSEQQDSATFQQVDTNLQSIASKQGEYSIQHSQVQKSQGNQYQPYEMISTKTTTTTNVNINPNSTASVRIEDDKVKRSAANPAHQQQIQAQPQQQIVLSKINNAQGGYSSQGMFKDSDDKGSSISYIPKDQTSKNAIPDENIGNAIGGGNGVTEYYNQNQGAESNFGISNTGLQTNQYNFTQTNSYVTPAQSYKPPVANVQDYSNKYTPVSTTTVTTYSTPAVTSYNPISMNVPPAQKYSSTYLTTNNYEIPKSTDIPTSSIGGSTGYYTSTKDQTYQPISVPPAHSTNITSQYTSDALSKPYQTTSYGLKENNFTYTPGPTNIGSTSVASSNFTTIPQANLPITNTYTSTNTYISPAINTQSSFLKKDEAIEEAIKRSAPPPLKNDVLSQNTYTSSIGANISASNNTNLYTPSSTIQTTSHQVSNPMLATTNNISSTGVTGVTYDPYKPSNEIEAILSKYRNQSGISSNANDFKASTTPLQNDVLQGGSSNTTAYNINSTSYQPYTSSTYTTTINQTGGVSDIGKLGVEGLSNQFGGLNISSNQPSSNIAVSQVQSNYTANFQPSLGSNTYQTTGITNIGTSSAPYTQTYNISQSFGQNKPFSGQYESSVSNSNQYMTQQDKEFVIENYSNNSKYEGEKYNGMRHGKGKFYYQDGGLFDGEWRENKMHGKGVLSYASGKPAYDGDWVDDKFEGFGVLYNENPAQLNGNYDYNDFDNVEEYWTKYEGSFKDDNKEGYGTLYLSNGEKFVGTFYKDFVNGQGTFYSLNGNVIQGSWNQNKLVSM